MVTQPPLALFFLWVRGGEMKVNKRSKRQALKIINSKRIQQELFAVFSKKAQAEFDFSRVTRALHEVYLAIILFINEFSTDDKNNKYYYQHNEAAKVIASRITKNLEQVSSDFDKLFRMFGSEEFLNVIEHQWFYEQHPVGQHLKESKQNSAEYKNFNIMRDWLPLWLAHVNNSEQGDIQIRKLSKEPILSSHICSSLKATNDTVKRVFFENWNSQLSVGRPDDKPRTYDLFQRLLTAFYTLSPNTKISYREGARFYKFAEIIAIELGEEKNLYQKLKAATWYTIELHVTENPILREAWMTEDEFNNFSSILELTPEISKTYY